MTGRKQASWILCAGTALLFLTGAAAEQVGAAPPDQATTAQSCTAAQCHAYRMAFRHSPHSALDIEDLADQDGAEFACAACHGTPTRRDKEPGTPGCEFEVLSFGTADSHDLLNAKCQTCHGSDHPGFQRSPHARAGMACNDCHDVHGQNQGRWPLQRVLSPPMGDSLRPDDPAATCSACHTAVAAQFELNERHRLQEGVVLCTDCHDPHDRRSGMLLGGFGHEACVDCHTDKGGPWVFEHGAQRVEGCLGCHSPHGSPNRYMLRFQSVGELCISCHAAVPGFHSRFTLESQCTECHASIHGSNLHEAFLR